MSAAYNIHDAKTHFSKLVAAVQRGERVIICRNGEPIIECVPIEKQQESFPFGTWKSLAKEDLGALSRLTDNETLDEMDL